MGELEASLQERIRMESSNGSIPGRIKENRPAGCRHFSIHGYVDELKKMDRKKCWPYDNSDDIDKLFEEIDKLPPLPVQKFKRWNCRKCAGLPDIVVDRVAESIAKEYSCCKSKSCILYVDLSNEPDGITLASQKVHVSEHGRANSAVNTNEEEERHLESVELLAGIVNFEPVIVNAKSVASGNNLIQLAPNADIIVSDSGPFEGEDHGTCNDKHEFSPDSILLRPGSMEGSKSADGENHWSSENVNSSERTNDKHMDVNHIICEKHPMLELQDCIDPSSVLNTENISSSNNHSDENEYASARQIVILDDSDENRRVVSEEISEDPCAVDPFASDEIASTGRPPKIRLVSDIIKDCERLEAARKLLVPEEMSVEKEKDNKEESEDPPWLSDGATLGLVRKKLALQKGINNLPIGSKKRKMTNPMRSFGSHIMGSPEELLPSPTPKRIKTKESINSRKLSKNSRSSAGRTPEDGKHKRSDPIMDEIPMDIVELMARNQQERRLFSASEKNMHQLASDECSKKLASDAKSVQTNVYEHSGQTNPFNSLRRLGDSRSLVTKAVGQANPQFPHGIHEKAKRGGLIIKHNPTIEGSGRSKSGKSCKGSSTDPGCNCSKNLKERSWLSISLKPMESNEMTHQNTTQQLTAPSNGHSSRPRVNEDLISNYLCTCSVKKSARQPGISKKDVNLGLKSCNQRSVPWFPDSVRTKSSTVGESRETEYDPDRSTPDVYSKETISAMQLLQLMDQRFSPSLPVKSWDANATSVKDLNFSGTPFQKSITIMDRSSMLSNKIVQPETPHCFDNDHLSRCAFNRPSPLTNSSRNAHLDLVSSKTSSVVDRATAKVQPDKFDNLSRLQLGLHENSVAIRSTLDLANLPRHFLTRDYMGPPPAQKWCKPISDPGTEICTINRNPAEICMDDEVDSLLSAPNCFPLHGRRPRKQQKTVQSKLKNKCP